PTGKNDVFSGLETLLNNSLIRETNPFNDEPKFRMLQTIQEYANMVLEKTGRMEEFRWAHTSYYADLTNDELGMVTFSGNSDYALKKMDDEQENFRLALDWSLTHEEGFPLAVMMMVPLSWYWYRYGHLQEGREWTDRALKISAGLGDSPLRVMALVGSGYLTLWTGDLILATEYSLEALKISERLKFDEGLALSKLGYGVTLINRGMDKKAYPHLVDAVELFDNNEQGWMKSAALVHLANVSLGMAEFEQAIHWLDLAKPLVEENGDIWNKAFIENNYGEVARALGDYEKAEKHYRRTDELYKEADARGDQARLVHTFGYIAQHKGEYGKAEDLFKESLKDFLELGNRRGIAECLAGLAGLAAAQDRQTWAAPLMGSAESQLNAIGGQWWPADRVEIESAKAKMQKALDNEFDALWEQGKAMGVAEAIEYANSPSNEMISK
ncbi:MAG: tetratricopeptide repeat protein, partial [Chloroflexota bacterium]